MPAATTNQASSLPVVTISDTTKLRVSVYVEQRDAAFVHVGDLADVTDASNPDRTTKVKISRTAGALDPKTRTLYIELDVDNRANFLVPGAFVYVTLRLTVPSLLQLPVSALVIRNNTSYVANITDAGDIKLHTVKVAGTDGDVITLSDGVQVGERVAINLPSEVGDGDRVQLVRSGK
jgi:multidrug efflux pump subunit AcrA (membrane-fusion protein)